MSVTVVDSVDLVRTLIDDIGKSSPQPPFLFIDLEGVNLSRHGSVAILQVLVPPARTVHLVDVHTLKGQAFETSNAKGMTMKAILESEHFPKVFFDVRNDSDALYSHFQIGLRGVIDMQLLEFATRPVHGKFLKGLSKCVTETAALSWTESREFQKIKDAGSQLFAPEKGGRYEVFHERPLPTAIIDYCAQDVLIMPKLLMIYGSQLPEYLATQVHSETLRRITLSQSSHFQGKGRHMAEGPAFVWKRISNKSPVCFPLSIVCSTDLPRYCSTDITSIVVQRADMKQGDAAATSELPGVQSTTPSRSMASVLERTESLSIEEPLNDSIKAQRNDDDDDEDKYNGLYDGPSNYAHSGDDESGKDFTACSGDDCGWCGHCDY